MSLCRPATSVIFWQRFYAKQMGIPIGKFVCASNENKVLFDFFQTGSYDRSVSLYVTSSPSMDILISSNLERLIYSIAGNDAEQCAEVYAGADRRTVHMRFHEEMKDQLQSSSGVCHRRRDYGEDQTGL